MASSADADVDALAAERELVASLGPNSRYRDPWCEPGLAAADALYHDCAVLPPGACAPELVRWCSIGVGNRIKGCFAPTLFPPPGTAWSPLRQGRLANAWWLNAVALLAASENGRRALRSLVVSDAHAASHGVYTVRFWKQGAWTVVHVDDRIPCDAGGTPLYSRCSDPNETWVLVLEKAYAKIHASYLNLENGRVTEALRDLTGGAVAWVQLDDFYKFAAHVPSLASRDDDRCDNVPVVATVVGARIEVAKRDASDLSRRSDGLRAGWIYGVSGAYENDSGKVCLAGLRDPWKVSLWRGPWSKRDATAWQDNVDVKEALCPDDELSDDELYMPWDFFAETFGRVLVCQFPTASACGPARVRFRGRFEASSLVSGAGGSPVDEVSWLTNPMIAVTVSEPVSLAVVFGQDADPRMEDFFSPSRHRGFARTATPTDDNDDDEDDAAESGSRPPPGLDTLRDTSGLGLVVLKVGDGQSGRRRASSFQAARVTGHSGAQYRADREVACVCKLAVGDYVIVPSTFAPKVAGAFVLECLIDAPAGVKFTQDPAVPLQDQLDDDDAAAANGDDDNEEEETKQRSGRAAARGRSSKLIFRGDDDVAAHDDLVSRRDLELLALQAFMQGVHGS